MTDGAEALQAAMELYLDLAVAPEHRAGVVVHLQAARRIAAPLLD